MPSLQAQPLLWQESLLLPQPSISRSIPLQPPASRTENVQFAFSLQQTGGAARLSTGTGGVAWQIDNGSAGSLQLSVFSLAESSEAGGGAVIDHHPNHLSPPSTQISLDFPTQIFPGVACVEHQQRGGALGTMVVGITATGIAFCIDLQRAMQQQRDAGNPAAGEQSFIRYADLSAHWPSVGGPSCIASADGHVLVGGALGPLLCLPLSWLQSPGPTAASQPFELRESGWGIKSFIAGVLQRQQSPSAVAVSPLYLGGSNRAGAAGAGGGMVVVMYDDCTLRGFSLSRRTQLFTESLELSPAAAAARAVPVFSALHMDPPSQSSTSTDTQATGMLVVQLECRDALHRSLAAYHVAAVAGGHRLAVRQRTDLAAPASASTLSAAVCGPMIWVLLKVPRGGTRLVGFDRVHGRLCATAALAEAGMLPHKLVKDLEGRDAMMMALWESSLAASINAAAPAEGAPDAEAGPSGGPGSAELAAVAAHQVLARLLSAGGGLCRLSLRDALAYHGAQMTVVEAETVPLKRLSTYAHATVHAIQRRSPNVSPARCWLALLGSYQEAWGRRHAPLCLLPPAYPSASQQHAPSSPLCLLRGSGMLAAVRETAPVEALAMDASDLSASSMGSSANGAGPGSHGAKAAASWHGGGPAAAFDAKSSSSSSSSASAAAALVAEGVLPPPLHPVHRAARGLSRLLGPLSLDAFISSLTPTPTPTTSHASTESSLTARGRPALGAGSGSGACVFEGGADAAAALAPAYATMVLEGPAGMGGGSKAGVGVGVGVTDDVSREQRVGWRQRRQKALLAVGQELGGLADLVGSIRAYCAYLTPQTCQVEGGPASVQASPLHHSPAAGTLVTTAARQLARAQMSAARDVLVLLGVLTQLGAVGSTPLTAQQLAELQGSVYGEVAVLLQQATLAFWLCSTHATAAAPAASPSQVPALEPALAFLRLGDSKEGGSRQLQQQQQQQQLLAPLGLSGRDVSLVARLLPSLAPQLPTSTHALRGAAASARALVVALQQGGSEATPNLPHITPSSSSLERGGMHTGQATGTHGATPLPVRVLQLGYQLFLANEHAPLMGLTRLAQAATASLPRSAISASAGAPGAAAHQAQGPEFLRGLSLACRLGGAPHEERQKRVSQAAGCFFRAAASLDPAGRGAQALVHATVLRSLRQLLTGYPEHEDDLQEEHASYAPAPTPAPLNTPSHHQAQQQRAFALLQVQLYEVVMMLFEREGAPEGAVIFARAALQHLPTAYGHHHLQPHPPTQQQLPSGREQTATAAAAGAGPSGAAALSGQQGGEIMAQDEEEARRGKGGSQGADGVEGMAIDFEAAQGPGSAGGGGASGSGGIGIGGGSSVWGRRRRQQQLRVREARLWSNIFKYCCELGQWEDAYAALVCNPDPQRALECLRQLVKELSERGEVLTLCALPLASAVCMQPPEEEEQSQPGSSDLQGSMLTQTAMQGGGATSMFTPVGPSEGQAQEGPKDGGAVGARGAGVGVGVGVGRKRGRAGLEEEEGSLGSTATAPLVSLLQEVVAALQRRALNMDLATQPQPYRLLYDFFVARSDMRGAARAMVAYARRLRAEGPPGSATVAEALTAYELALNALALQDPEDAWLDVHSDPWLAAHTVPGASPPAFPLAGAADLDGGPADVGADGPAGTSASAVGARVGGVAITQHALTLEYVLMRASAEVVATGASPGTDPLQAQRSPEDVLSQLLGVRAYDSAHRLALCAWPAGRQQQTRALEALAGAMAREAARLQLQGEGGGDAAGPFADFLSSVPPSTRAEGTPSSPHPQQQQQPPAALAQAGGPSTNTNPAAAPSAASPLPLLPPVSAAGLGAQDPGLVEGLCGQSLMGSCAAPAWAKLRAFLATYAGTSGLGSALRCSAVAAILREDPRMHLPPWLLEMFQGGEEAGGTYEGMASAGCGPAELVDLYMSADRLEDAVAVVAEHVSRWSNTDPRLRRGRLAAAWFPHRRIKALRQRLRAAGADTSALDSAMAHHHEVLEHDAPVAQLPGPSSSNAGQPGLLGAPFEPILSFR